MVITKQTFDTIFNRVVTFFLTLLIVGIPLAFTASTRSVFEVNKLLVLRLSLLIIYGLWLFKYVVYKDNDFDHKEEDCYRIFGFRWKRIGLEIPVLAWIILNFISSIFSPNVYISIIGAYDRWEGISTNINYILLVYMVAKLVCSFRLRYWIIAITIISTFISSFYGILQSLGFDFMNWNADPTVRVFACINNPVHFCAYVAMCVPLGFSLVQRILTTPSSSFTWLTEKRHIIITVMAQFLVLLPCLYFAFSTAKINHYIYFFILLIPGNIILFQYKDILPSMKTVGNLCLYFVLCLSTFILNINILNKFQIFSLICCLATTFLFSALHDKKVFKYRAALLISLGIFYSMMLSYSRATLVGFSIGMAFYLIHFFQSDKRPSLKSELVEMICIFTGLFLFNIALIFKLHFHGTLLFLVQTIFLLIAFLLFHVTHFQEKRPVFQLVKTLPIYFLMLLPFYKLSFFSPFMIPLLLLCISSFYLVRPEFFSSLTSFINEQSSNN